MEKWKVLIADDEWIIRDGIISSVDWAAFNMEMVAEAEDGEEALELAVDHQVDVVLIDLNMPIMDGITAMKKIKQVLPDCRMVVISGYDDFQYAQEAIRLQVEDYLLKPINPDQIKAILGEVKQLLEQKKDEEKYLQQVSRQVRKNHKHLKNRFFLDWMKGSLREEEVKNQLQFLELPQSEPQSLILIKWSDEEGMHFFLKEEERHQYMEAMELLLEEELEDVTHEIFQEDMQWIAICIWETVPVNLTLQLENVIAEELKQTIYATHVNLADSSVSSEYSQAKQNLDQYMSYSPIVKQAIRYIREYYCNPEMTLESIAEELHVSTVYLSKMIKQELGISYVKLVTSMRMEASANLLKITDLSIREIAERVGYDSQHYFSTAFRKFIGMTPKQFKQQ